MKYLNFIIVIAGFVTIFCNGKAQTSFEKHTISSVGNPMDVMVCDINGDGFKDLATVTNSGEVAWWENTGSATFIKHSIRNGFTGARSVRTGDIDGDGDIDLFAASFSRNEIEWYENNGSQTFTSHMLDGNFRGAHTVQMVDLDRDGDQDIVCSGWDNTPALSEVAWWENTGNKQFTKRTISVSLDQSPFVDVADFDGDGDLDLVGSDETTGEVYWWQNNGQESFTQFLVDAQFNLAHTVLARDIDKDGDFDILGAACTSGLQAWYENLGSGIFEKHPMENLAGALWLDAGDFDLDGDTDMVATGMSVNQMVLYINSGRQQFTRSLISGELSSGFALNVADLDNDGDPDIVAIGYNSNYLGWWENKLSRVSLIQSPSWICKGSENNRYLAINNNKGNVIKVLETEPVCGVVNPKTCQGIVCSEGILFAASGSEIVFYNPESGIRINSSRTDAQYFEGITVDPDGRIYAAAPVDGKIVVLEPSTGEIINLATGLDYPRAVKYDPFSGQLLVLDGEETCTVKSFDRETGKSTILATTMIISGGDIEPDGLGNYYISSPQENAIYILKGLGSGKEILFKSDLNGPWGMKYDSIRSELVVAMNSADRIEKIGVSATGIVSVDQGKVPLQVYPNPFSDFLNISLPCRSLDECIVDLVSIDGKTLFSKKIPAASIRINPGIISLNLSDVQLVEQGIYFLKLYNGLKTTCITILHDSEIGK